MNNEYLQRYLSLPPEIREQISTSENREIFNQLEKEYQLDIAEIVSRLLINDLSFNDLTNDLVNNYKLNQASARIVKDSLSKILLPILSNLTQKTKEPAETGVQVPTAPLAPIATESRDNILTKEEISELAAQPRDISGAGLDRQASLAEADRRRRVKTDEMISDIMSHFSLPDPVATGRLKNIIIKYLKDIRDEIETKDVLTRSFKVGGMEFDNSQADFLISVLKNKKNLLHQFESKAEKIDTPPADLAQGLKTTADFMVKSASSGSAALESKKESKKVQFEEGAMAGLENFQCPLPGREIAGPAIVKLLPASPKPGIGGPTEAETKNESLSLKIKDIPYIEPKPIEPIKEVFQKIVEPPKIELVAKEAPIIPSDAISPEPTKAEDLFTEPLTLNRTLPDETQRGRIALEEVKVTPKIYGPADELRTIRLIDWRRWKNPREAANRVQDKVNLLGEDSLLKAAQGIKAWKESEVNRLYLEIGLEALAKEKTIEEVISSRLKENQPALTFEEFNVISELNEKLRF